MLRGALANMRVQVTSKVKVSLFQDVEWQRRTLDGRSKVDTSTSARRNDAVQTQHLYAYYLSLSSVQDLRALAPVQNLRFEIVF